MNLGCIYEPESKQQNETKSTKLVRSRRVLNKMIACFFRKTDHVATVSLEDRRTVNAD